VNKMYQKRCVLGHIIEHMRHFLGGNFGGIMKYIV
jgi:hypothetical protein